VDQHIVVVAVTGASGAPYAKRLIEALGQAGASLHLIVSPHGRQVLTDELSEQVAGEILAGRIGGDVTVHAHDDLASRLASGSFRTDGMVVCPCSSNTLAAIAAGLSDNLITRAAQVTLKERRRLILVPREMPVTLIDLENMLRASRAGAVICPASPGFYMRPSTIEQLLDFVAGRVLDLLGIAHPMETRWPGNPRQVRPGGWATVR